MSTLVHSPARSALLGLLVGSVASLAGCSVFGGKADCSGCSTAAQPNASDRTAMGVVEATRGPRFVGGETLVLPKVESTMLVAIYGETPAGPALPGASGEANLRQVSFAMEGGDFTPDIDRGGTFLIYASRQHAERFDLYRKSVDGRTVTQLTSDPADDMMPAISPDGSKVAFVSNRTGNWDLFVMTIDGGPPTQMTFDRDDEVQPTWSPDGRSLAFARRNSRTGRWEIWTTDTTQPGATTYLCDGFLPRWCPDGTESKLLFQRARQQGSRLFGIWTVDVVNGEATSPTEIVSAVDAAVIQPAWSPDGRRIVFATVTDSSVAAGQPGASTESGQTVSTLPEQADLWIVNADGSGRINLISDVFRNMQPVWSQSDRIYFVSNRSGVENIWALTPASSVAPADGSPVAPRSGSVVGASEQQH